MYLLSVLVIWTPFTLCCSKKRTPQEWEIIAYTSKINAESGQVSLLDSVPYVPNPLSGEALNNAKKREDKRERDAKEIDLMTCLDV